MGAGSNGRDENAVASTDAHGSPLRRRQFVAAGVTASIASLAGCPEADAGSGSPNGTSGTTTRNDVTMTPGAFEGEQLRVLVWEGEYATRFENTVKPLFEQRSGADLVIETDWANVLNRIRDAPEREPPYDVTVTDGLFYWTGRRDGLFEKIRPENVPNLENVVDHYSSIRPTSHGVPVDGTPCTIVYRDDLEFEPSSWAAMFRDSVRTGLDFGFKPMSMHAIAVGMDEAPLAGELYDESMHDAVIDRVDTMDINGFVTTGDDLWGLFADGKVDVAQWYYEQTTTEIGDRNGVAQAVPEENTGVLNHYCVVKNTRKRELAEAFLNFLLDAETQTQWATESPTLFTNSAVSYSEGRGVDLPSTNAEASKIDFPDYETYFDYSEKFNEALEDKQ